jgi:hypothetical protein
MSRKFAGLSDLNEMTGCGCDRKTYPSLYNFSKEFADESASIPHPRPLQA